MGKKQDTAVNSGVKPMSIPGTGTLGEVAFYEPFQPSPKALKSPKWGIHSSLSGKVTTESLERWKPILKEGNWKDFEIDC